MSARLLAVCAMLAAAALPVGAGAQQGPPVVQPVWINGVLTCPPGYHGPISTTPGGAEVCIRNN